MREGFSNLPQVFTLAYVDQTVGTGEPAKSHMFYTVNYTGYLLDGTKFDSSYDHPDKKPISFPYGAHRVIPGWDTGFEGMHVGGKRRLFVPFQLAYGANGRPPQIPAKAELIFDMELVSQSAEDPTPRPSPPPQSPLGAPTTAPGGRPAGTAPGSTSPGSPSPSGLPPTGNRPATPGQPSQPGTAPTAAPTGNVPETTPQPSRPVPSTPPSTTTPPPTGAR